MVEIADTGTGLTAEECERLFTPYYTSKAHGTGLGLAIVQSVISDHGGRISVRSEPGRGTTFIIELPRNWEKLEADKLSTDALASEELNEAERKESVSSNTSANPSSNSSSRSSTPGSKVLS